MAGAVLTGYGLRWHDWMIGSGPLPSNETHGTRHHGGNGVNRWTMDDIGRSRHRECSCPPTG